MADNYRFTAERTGRSSKALHEAGEFFDSCYLAGYVVECYQKLIYQFVTTNDPKQVHDLSILKQELKYIKKSGSRASYLQKNGMWLDVELACQRIYNNWGPEHRYDDAYDWNELSSTDYQREVKRCLTVIAKLKLNGSII